MTRSYRCPECQTDHSICEDLEVRIQAMEEALRPLGEAWTKSVTDPLGVFVPGGQLNPLGYVRPEMLMEAHRALKGWTR